MSGIFIKKNTTNENKGTRMYYYAFTVSMMIKRALLCLAALLAICMRASGIERAKYAAASEFITTK